MRDYLVLYGNYSLKNNKLFFGDRDNESSSSNDITTLSISRTDGVKVTSNQRSSKMINLEGNLGVYDKEKHRIEDLIKELNTIFSRQNRYLRVIPKWTSIATASDTWTGSGDVANQSVDSIEYQYNDRSVKFDVDVSVSGSHFVGFTCNPSSVDLTEYIDSGSIDFWVDIPDIYYVTSVDFRIGSNSSNYWSYSFNTNYEGQNLENGVNHFSVPFSINSAAPCFSNRMTGIGAPYMNDVNYIYIQINYESVTSDILNCHLGDVYAVDENLAMNYRCYRQSEVRLVKNHPYSTKVRKYSVDLLNPTGYSEATHKITLFDVAGITSLSSTQKVDLKGSYLPLLSNQFRLNTATNLEDLRFINLSTNELIRWTNTWAVDDVLEFDGAGPVVTKNGNPQDFVGKIPSNQLGVNYLKMEVVDSASVLISQELNDVDVSFYNRSSSNYKKVAQSFIATATGTLTQIEIPVKVISSIPLPSLSGRIRVNLYTNSGGNPGSLIDYRDYWTGNSPDYFWLTTTWNQAVTNGTTYWIVVEESIGGDVTNYWGKDSSASYGSGQAKFITQSLGWTSEAGDRAFRVNIQPPVSTNIDWKATYKPRYV